ncbi:MAG: 16S rRNA (uracil(1498)-N(3))-methyltransferase [Alphaproteobacteria bacterium]|nr:16S rRNA (uracil(1498)-N(3))-methyltransferase [Rickettsiales bacterium]
MRIRIYHADTICQHQPIALSNENTHHLKNVLRVKEEQIIFCFNQTDEWECKVLLPNKQECVIIPTKRTRTHVKPKIETHLFISSIKHNAMHDVISNATQLGVTNICPIMSERSSSRHLKIDKLITIAQQSAAQCNRIDVPQIMEIQTLKNAVTTACKINAPILWANETISQQENAFLKSVDKIKKIVNCTQNIAILIGPEGGFSQNEVAFLNSQNNDKEIIIPILISNNILRTSTAVTAVLQTVFTLLH